MSANLSFVASTAQPAVEFDLTDKDADPSASRLGDTSNAVCDSRHHNALLVSPEFALDGDDAKENASEIAKGKKGKATINQDFGRDQSIFALSVKPNQVSESVQGKMADSIVPGSVPGDGAGVPTKKDHTESVRKSKRARGRTKDAARTFVEVGDPAPDFELEDSMGIKHKLSDCRGRKVLLSFFRFAACHICLYNIDMMQKQYDMLRKAGIVIICVFKSTPENISKFASQTLGDGMLALSDKQGSTYKSYQVKRSTKAVVKGPWSTFKNREKLRPYFSKGFFQDASVSGMRLLPADFLIDESGVIVDLFRAESPAKQHLSFERIEAFIPEGKRCKCNQRDCISPTCQRKYVEQTGDRHAVLGPDSPHARCARRQCIQT